MVKGTKAHFRHPGRHRHIPQLQVLSAGWQRKRSTVGLTVSDDANGPTRVTGRFGLQTHTSKPKPDADPQGEKPSGIKASFLPGSAVVPSR